MSKISWLLAIAILFAACNATSSGETPPVTPTPSPISVTSTLPAGPAPSYRVAAFYYPWYGNPQYDKAWIHWNQNAHEPPQDIASDYYPELGPYSSNDPTVVARHMSWLRQAGVGVIIVSWWGQGSKNERAVPLILQTAAQYEIKVAFHIEPYKGRTAEGLVSDIKYLYEQYGKSRAFFRSNASSTYSPGNGPKGMFFIWCIKYPGPCGTGPKVDAAYWQKSMDEIHALPDGALVIANTTDGSWVGGGHFDGLYNYTSLHYHKDGGFGWARTLPPGALYMPSVIPGFSAKRVGYPADTFVPRDDGKTYADQWTAALGTGVQPEMVTITSFNEWHEGSFIEPIATGANDGHGYGYADFGALPPEGYLDLTRQWVDKFASLPVASTYPARIQIKTTSDWTTPGAVKGGHGSALRG